MELFARSPKKSLPFALAIGYWRWEGKKDPYIYKVYRGARKSASFFVFSTIVKILSPCTSLTPCLIPPRDDRETTERRAGLLLRDFLRKSLLNPK